MFHRSKILPRRVQECGDRALLIDVGPFGKIERVDPAERAIGTVAHERLDGRDRIRVGRLP
jgi:hypothetical protein